MFCLDCLKKMAHTCAWSAITWYTCNICHESKWSWNTHTPWYCCETCSERLVVCEECGSSDIYDGKWSELVNYKWEEKDTIVLYHANCLDWFGAAFSAWKYFNQDDLNVAIIPISYGEKIPSFEGKKIYFLDFSLKRNEYLTLAEFNEIITIDHHKSALAELEWLEWTIFDMDKSGCVLAFEYFFPNEKVPDYLKLIEDYDLYRFKYKKTKDFIAWMELHNMKSFWMWNEVLEDNISAIVKDWKVVNAYRDVLIENLNRSSVKISINGIEWYAVNSNDFLASDLWNRLCRTNAFGCVWYVKPDGRVKVSLRSVWELDVSLIAASFWGGWHKNASWFITDINTFYSFLE